MSFVCDFCQTDFKSKRILNFHIQNAKFCLVIKKYEFQLTNEKEKYEHYSRQKEEQINDIIKKYEFQLTNEKEKYDDDSKQKDEQINDVIKKYESQLKNQEDIIKKYEFQLKNQEEIIKKYEFQLKNQEEKYEVKINVLVDKLDALATKGIGKTTINNTNNIKTIFNIFPSQKEIDQKIECQFTDTYVQYGIKGVAKFLYDKVFKLEDDSLVYNCVDVARHIFKFKDKDGNEIKDHKATKLIKMIKPGIITPKTVYDFVNRECADLEKTDDKKKYDKMIELYEGMLAIIQLIKMENGV